jgi:hypothetical protein
MKQCPKCSSSFPDEDRFCEIDGTPLLPAVIQNSNTNKKMLLLIAVVGTSLGVVLVFAYLSFSNETAAPQPSNSSIAQQQFAPVAPSRPDPTVEPSPSPSIASSPSPSVEPSPSPQISPSPVQFSSSQISVGAGAPAVTGQLIIRLVSGAKIEAEEVWQTGEGIWYRKGTVISMLDPKNVKSIDKVPAAPPSTVPPAPTPIKATSP